jgi:hypothetical protein
MFGELVIDEAPPTDKPRIVDAQPLNDGLRERMISDESFWQL